MAAFFFTHVRAAGGKITSSKLLTNYFNNSLIINNFSLRYLYSGQFLGIDKFVELRERISGQFGGLKEKFCNRMKESIEREGQQVLVFTEDLKNMVYLAENKPEDLEICLKMMRKFNQQNKELRFGTFVFGPVTMRLFHFMEKPELVIQALEDEELQGFFDQTTSYHIAMDLLWKKEKYVEILKVFDSLQERQLYGTKYPRECVVLALAACYRLNTPASYKTCTEIIQGAREAGATVLRRGLTFAAALSLKQNDAKNAMEILALTPQANYITVRNLKLLTLAELDRLDDIFPILRSIVDRDVPKIGTSKPEICQSTLDILKSKIEALGDKEMMHIFEQVCRALRENNHISTQTIDDLLYTPINKLLPRDTSYQGGGSTYARRQFGRPQGSNYYGQSGRQTPQYPSQRRQGLRDMDE